MIKIDIEMPEGCTDCLLCDNEMYYCILADKLGIVISEENGINSCWDFSHNRPENCPLNKWN